MSCKSDTLCGVSRTAQSELSIWRVVCSLSASDLTSLVRYKTASIHLIETYSYEKKYIYIYLRGL
jgi:hypothetical protein